MLGAVVTLPNSFAWCGIQYESNSNISLPDAELCANAPYVSGLTL